MDLVLQAVYTSISSEKTKCCDVVTKQYLCEIQGKDETSNFT